MSEKKIILELKRINKIMGLKSNPDIIIEQSVAGAPNRGTISRTSEYTAPSDADDDTWSVWTMGPKALDLDFVGFNKTPTQILGYKNKGTNSGTGKPPKVWRFNESTKIEDIIPAKKYGGIKRGKITGKNGVVFENQPYIESEGVKHCLPSQIWFDVYSRSLGAGQEGPVYKFENPKTRQQFAITMRQYERAMDPGVGQLLTGPEISMGCYGGDNGWEFVVDNIAAEGGKEPATPYKLVGGDEYYNISNLEMFDPRSVNDVFWDEWGLKLEIGIGILVALVVPPLGAAAWTAIGFEAAGLAYTVFIVTAEIVMEGTLLAPKIINAWNRGNKTDATVTALFCLLPILMQWKPASKFLSEGIGGKYSHEAVESLLTKVEGAGGFQKIYSKNYLTDPDAFKKAFYDSLTETEKEVLTAGNKMLKNIEKAGQKATEEELNAIMTATILKNETKLSKLAKASEKAIGKGKEFSQLRFKVAWILRENLWNLKSGKGFVPVLARGAIAIGPIAMGLNWISDKIYGPSKEELWTEEMKKRMCDYIKGIEGAETPESCVNTIIEKAFDPNSPTYANGEQKSNSVLELDVQLKSLVYLYKAIGWSDQKIESTLKESMDTSKIEKMVKDGDISPELMNERINEMKKDAIEDAKAKKDEIVNEIIESKATIKTIFLADNILAATGTIFNEVIVKILGYEISKIIAKGDYNSFDKTWEFLIKNEPKDLHGKIEFEKISSETGEDYTFKIFIDNVEVYPEKGVKSNETQTTSTNTETNTDISKP